MRLRRVSILMVAALVLSAVFCGPAFAFDTFSNGGVSLTVVSVDPADLSGAGSVTVAVKVTVDASRAEGGLNNVRVEGFSATVQEITIGASATLHFTLPVSASQLGSSIPLKLRWDGAGETSLPFTVTVGSSGPAQPDIKFTRTIDKETFRKGDTLTVKYNISNYSDAEITDIVVTDAGIPDMEQKRDSLKSGLITLSETVSPSADFVSTPKLTYTVNGVTKTKTIASLTVPMESTDLQVILDASLTTVPPNGETTLNCTLTNSGNTKLTDISISEKSLGDDIFKLAALDSGESKQFTRTVKLTAATTFLYVVTAKDESGVEGQFTSNPLDIAVDQTGRQYDVDIMAVPDVLQLSQPGNVNFTISVRNNSADPVSGISITDQSGTVIIQDTTLNPGEKQQFTHAYQISATTQYTFKLTVSSGGNAVYEKSSDMTEIDVAPAASASAVTTATPDVTAVETAAAGSSDRMVTLITALLIIGILIIITLLVLFGMIAVDKRKRGGKNK